MTSLSRRGVLVLAQLVLYFADRLAQRHRRPADHLRHRVHGVAGPLGADAYLVPLLVRSVRPQLAGAETVLRIGMTAADIPRTLGQPDQGFEGNRFTGLTMYDALTMWDLSSADKPSIMIPGLATEWVVDAADKKKWEHEYAWEHSHFWDYPMLPQRFVESSCLQCHHRARIGHPRAGTAWRGHRAVDDLHRHGACVAVAWHHTAIL